MKLLKRLVVIMAVLILTASFGYAAGSSFKVTSDVVYYSMSSDGFTNGPPAYRIITCTFTGDNATGAIPDLTLSDAADRRSASWTDGTNSGTLQGGVISAWYGFFVEIDGNHAGTEPTEDSELYVLQNGIDLLGGHGVDQVDNTAERTVPFYVGSNIGSRPIYGDVIVRVTQQAAATASATGTIRIFLFP